MIKIGLGVFLVRLSSVRLEIQPPAEARIMNNKHSKLRDGRGFQWSPGNMREITNTLQLIYFL